MLRPKAALDYGASNRGRAFTEALGRRTVDAMVTPAEIPISLILIIEDDATISDLVAYNLSRAGYRVRKETNGRNGLEAALSDEVDLVLMDLMLPGLDGLAATREIKRQKPDLPVVMLTARDERGEVLEGFDTGA